MSVILTIQNQLRTQPRKPFSLSEPDKPGTLLCLDSIVFLTVFFLTFLYCGSFNPGVLLLGISSGTAVLLLSGRCSRERIAAVCITLPLVLVWYNSGAVPEAFESPVIDGEFTVLKGELAADSAIISSGIMHDIRLVSATGTEGKSGTVTGNLTCFVSGGERVFSWGEKVLLYTKEAPQELMYVSEEQLAPAGWRNNFFRLRSRISRNIQIRMAGVDPSGLLSTILLGKMSSISVIYKRQIRLCGASHLLALSGFHLGILLGVIHAAAGKYRKRIFSRVIIISAGWIYHLLIGPLSSLTRAAATITVLLMFGGGFHVWKLKRSLTAGTVCIILINPSIIQEPGFRLSYFALYSILLLSPLILRYTPGIFPNPVRTSIAASLAAQFGTIGLTSTMFGTVPLFSSLYILLLTPVVTIYAFTGLGVLFLQKAAKVLIVLRLIFSRIIAAGEYNIVFSASQLFSWGMWVLTGVFLLYTQISMRRKHYDH